MDSKQVNLWKVAGLSTLMLIHLYRVKRFETSFCVILQVFQKGHPTLEHLFHSKLSLTQQHTQLSWTHPSPHPFTPSTLHIHCPRIQIKRPNPIQPRRDRPVCRWSFHEPTDHCHPNISFLSPAHTPPYALDAHWCGCKMFLIPRLSNRPYN